MSISSEKISLEKKKKRERGGGGERGDHDGLN